MSFKLFAQNFSNIIDSCVIFEKENGGKEIIVSAEFAGWHNVGECLIFIKTNQGKFKVRHLLFNNKKLQDVTYYDNNISEIFEIENSIHDSLVRQIENINKLLHVKYENGHLVMTEISDAKRRYLGVVSSNIFINSNTVLTELNEAYYKANYYWVISSLINNYMLDNKKQFQKSNNNSKKERK